MMVMKESDKILLLLDFSGCLSNGSSLNDIRVSIEIRYRDFEETTQYNAEVRSLGQVGFPLIDFRG
jgi:hypothetical protein